MFSGTPIEFQDEPLTNNGFWPDLNLSDFQSQRKIPADVAANTIAQALLTTVADVNGVLASIEEQYRAEGYQKAESVQGVSIGGVNALCAQYTKAVFALAKADLMGEIATVGRRETHPGQESNDTRTSLLAEGAMVIRRMNGLSRATVELI